MKSKFPNNCVEIQLPSKGLKDKKGFPIKRTLYANIYWCYSKKLANLLS